jgi:hypothetical protein
MHRHRIEAEPVDEVRDDRERGLVIRCRLRR